MTDDIAIKVEHVSKTFKLPHEKQSSIKGALIGLVRGGKRTYERQEVLKDVSFEIKKGEFFGIVGRNGSGKSTLLKMLAGIYTPSKGHVQVNGKLTPFIELGVGFNPELTGRENVFLNGALLGFNRAEMLAMYDDIVTFAELEKFMDQKLKNYSSGMQVRLAFSIAIRAKSDILLIDEVLAVGDAAFQAKCFDYFSELKNTGTTVVFVSHDRTSLERFCERGVLISEGRLVEVGGIKEVLHSYATIVLDELGRSSAHDTESARQSKAEFVEIEGTDTYDSAGTHCQKFTFGDKVEVGFTLKIKNELKNPIIGVTVWQKSLDKAVYAVNTLTQGVKETGVFLKGDTVSFMVSLPSTLNDGEYIIEPAVANDSGTVFYAQEVDACRFFVSGSNNPHAILADETPISLEVYRK